VIIAILEDLMFISKIKTAASQLGVAVTFARSADAARGEMQKATPSMVILDLNSARTDPLGIVRSMKANAELASIPTVGFVSHVQTDVINLARQAGVDEVLARSAFTAQLADILRRTQRP
jgi:PleD family two-component response regulator